MAETLKIALAQLNPHEGALTANAALIRKARAEAARLLGLAPPPEVPFEQAVLAMSEMGRSFWAENRRVASARTQEMLGYRWRYPSFREGLRAILAAGG